MDVVSIRIAIICLSGVAAVCIGGLVAIKVTAGADAPALGTIAGGCMGAVSVLLPRLFDRDQRPPK